MFLIVPLMISSSLRRVALATALVFGACQGIQAQTTQEGMRALEFQQFSTAKTIFSKLLANAPTAENHFHLGNYYLKTGKLDSALIFYQKGQQADAKNQLNTVGFGAVKLMQNDPNAAEGLFNQAITATKAKNADVYYFIADAYLNAPTPNPIAAIRNLDVAIMRNPKKIDFYLLRGDAFGAQKEANKAVENYNQALALEPNSARAILRKGKFYERVRNYTEAANQYKLAITKDPNYPQPYKELGEVYYLAKRYDDAVDNYNKYISMTDRNDDIMLTYAQFLYRSKKYDEGLKIINDLIVRMPQNPGLLRGQALIYNERNEMPAAKAAVTSLFALPNTQLLVSDTLLRARIMYKSGGDTTEAVNTFNAAFRKDTLLENEVRTMAKGLYDAGKYNFAIPLFKSIKELTPRNQNIDYYNYARAVYYAALANPALYQEADTAFAETYKKYPTFNTALYYRGLTQYIKDKTGAQGLYVPYFEQYIQVETDKVKYKPYFKTAYGSLATYYCSAKNDKAKAHELFNKVLEVDPTNTKAKDGLKANCEKLPAPAPVKPAAPAKPAPKKK